jgi:hypothetical protein
VRRLETDRVQFCCSGCALASRLPPVGEGGQFPVTRALIATLVVSFAGFNEALFWTLALALAHQHQADQAWLLGRVSATLGMLVWLALAVAIGRAPMRRWGDAVVALATLAVVVVAVWPPLAAGGVLAANAVLGLWLSRGWCKQKFFRKKSVPV